MLNKIDRRAYKYENGTNLDIGDYLNKLSKKTGIDTSKCKEALDKVTYLSLGGIIAGNSSDNFREYAWGNSLFFHEDNFNFINYMVYGYKNEMSEEDVFRKISENYITYIVEEGSGYKSYAKQQPFTVKDETLVTKE